MRHKHPLTLLQALLKISLLTFCLLGNNTYASESDTQQPINIEADRAEINEMKGISSYTGNVILHQGSIEIKADAVMIYTQDGQPDRITATGRPLHFKQQRDNAEDVLGVSQRMEYTAGSKRLLLLGEAELSQGVNRFSGHRIQYDPGTERVIATSDTSKESSTSTQKPPKRVTITLQPSNKNSPSESNTQNQP